MKRTDAILRIKGILEKKLVALRKALAGDLNSLIGEHRPGDIMDAAQDGAAEELNSSLAEVEAREINRIEVALERMRAGQYGKCETCECNIPLPRLEALPYATRCIKCQRDAEREGGSSGHKVDWSLLLKPPFDEEDPAEAVTAADLEVEG